MCKVVKFPSVGQADQPELEPDEAIVPEVIEEDYALIYAPDENYITRGKCFRCNKKLSYTEGSEQTWHIRGNAGYGSELDGSEVDIEICDTCLTLFLDRKIMS